MEYWSGGVALIIGLELTCRVKINAFPSSLPCVLCALCGWSTALFRLETAWASSPLTPAISPEESTSVLAMPAAVRQLTEGCRPFAMQKL